MTATKNKNSSNPKSKRSSLQSSSISTQQPALPLPSSSQPQHHDKNIKNLHDVLTSLLVSPNPSSAQDVTDLEELVSLMKKHTLFDPAHIPQLHHTSTSVKPSVTTIISSDNSGSNNSTSTCKGRTTTPSYVVTEKTNVAPVPNFEFSFSSDRQVNFPLPPEKRVYTIDRPTYRRGGVYTDEYDEVENVKLEDQMKPEELEAIIQQRKILPLPKSRWSQKHFTATASDEENKNNEQDGVNNNKQGLSSSSKLTAGIVGQQQERIARRSPGKPSNRLPASSVSSTTIKTSSSQLPLSAISKESQRFILAVDRQSSKLGTNINDENDKKGKELVLNNNLTDTNKNVGKVASVKSTVIPDKQKQQQKQASFKSEASTRSKKSKSKKSASVTMPTDDNDNNKKNIKTSTTKKGKKSQAQLEQQQLLSSRKDWLGADLNFSDLSMIKNGNPDDWICLFCQYEIFCSGLEPTIRKRGGYRRQRYLRGKDNNDSISQHHRKYTSRLDVEEEDEGTLSSLAGMSEDSRVSVVTGISRGPGFQ